MDIIYRFDPFAKIEWKNPKNNKEALQLLTTGNDRFATMVAQMQSAATGEKQHPPTIVPINPVKLGVPLVSGLEPAHSPFAMVLGCADARVPVEQILDCSANDLFVVRVAGNVLGTECLGSVDYAATHLKSSIRSGIVLGHTQCGAVTAAVDIYLSPAGFTAIASSHAVRSLVDRIMLSVRGAERALERVHGAKVQKHKRYREMLITTATYLNAAVTAFDVQRELNAIGKGITVSYTVYDMAWSRVCALPVRTSEEAASVQRFAAAPRDTDEFVKLSEKISERL